MIDISREAPKTVSADEAKRGESAKLTSERRPGLRLSDLYCTGRVSDRRHSLRRLAPQPKLDRNFTLLLRLPESLRFILHFVRMDGYCRKTRRLGVGFELNSNRNGLLRGQAPRSRVAIEVI
jgi:hypothetical protein